MGPSRRAMGTEGPFCSYPWLRGSLEAMCLQEVERFHSHKSPVAEKSPRSPQTEAKTELGHVKNSWEGSGAQNKPCCSSKE